MPYNDGSEESADDNGAKLGTNGQPVEHELEESVDAIVTEGCERLSRTWRTTLITGFVGGIEVGVGVMAYLAVLESGGSHLLAGVAFGVGFVALLLAHSELFTENFLVPIAAVAARQGSIGQLAKLWLGTLVANLAGGWVIMILIVWSFPSWIPVIDETAQHFIDIPFGIRSSCLAVLGGAVITLMTRMQQGTESDPARIAAAMVGGFLLAGLQLFHSILDSLFIFGAIQSGSELNYLDWLGWFGRTLLFNVVGGVVLVTALRLVRTKELLAEKREESGPQPA